MLNKKQLMKLVLILLAGITVFDLIYNIGTHLESQNNNGVPEFTAAKGISYIDRREAIEVRDNKYAFKRDVSSYLIAGVDKDSFDNEKNISRSRSQADFIMLVVADHNKEEVYCIAIDRDTITDITILSLLGKPKGTQKAQIALSYAYSNEPKVSAQLLVNAVENLLLGISIDHYLIFSMDTVSALNESVGGVKVHIGEDLTSVDPQFVVGSEIILQDDQAIKFVRARKNVGDGTNIARISRQNTFLNAFFSQLASITSDDKTAAKAIIDKLFPLIDCSAKKGQIINDINRIRCYSYHDPIVLGGVRQISKSNNMEFYVDESHLLEILLDIFYEKIG